MDIHIFVFKVQPKYHLMHFRLLVCFLRHIVYMCKYSWHSLKCWCNKPLSSVYTVHVLLNVWTLKGGLW